jgi:hypothetical protein
MNALVVKSIFQLTLSIIGKTYRIEMTMRLKRKGKETMIQTRTDEGMLIPATFAVARVLLTEGSAIPSPIPTPIHATTLNP